MKFMKTLAALALAMPSAFALDTAPDAANGSGDATALVDGGTPHQRPDGHRRHRRHHRRHHRGGRGSRGSPGTGKTGGSTR